MSRKIVIIGAGPTGLGAAYRLRELNYRNWEIYERNSYIGGLASSFVDTKNFVWDIGGHVLFSNYEYVDNLINKLLGEEYILHRREAFIRIQDVYIPYPFQNNIHHLPKDKAFECLAGLEKQRIGNQETHNFREWILATFGEGIAKYFMLPYNSKIWCYPLDLMDVNWINERVSVIDYERALKNVLYNEDDCEWGPNSWFRFPLYGGTGSMFNKFLPYIGEHLHLNEEMSHVDLNRKVVRFSSGKISSYDVLINTTPLDLFVYKMNPTNNLIISAAKSLIHNGILSVGIGIRKPTPCQKSWIYFPEENCCFYRVTYFSNYSPNNVPNSKQYHSLICETSYSDYKPMEKHDIVEKTIQGLYNTKLLSKGDKKSIETTNVIQAEYAYPIPTLNRDRALETIQPYLEKNGIFSRGRFGAWKYESGNMDHSIMQGVEVVNRILGIEDN